MRVASISADESKTVQAVSTNGGVYVPKSTDNDVENYWLRELILGLPRETEPAQQFPANVTRMSELRYILDRKKERKKDRKTEKISMAYG